MYTAKYKYSYLDRKATAEFTVQFTCTCDAEDKVHSANNTAALSIDNIYIWTQGTFETASIDKPAKLSFIGKQDKTVIAMHEMFIPY